MTAADQTPATDSERVERLRRVQYAHFDGDGNDLGPCVLVSDLKGGGPAEQWLSHGDAESEHTRVLAKGGAQDTGWLHAACSCGEYAWPCPHWLLAEHDRLTALLAEQAATIERVRGMHRMVTGGTPVGDPADMCEACPSYWPCPTITALGSQRTEWQG